MNLLMMMNMTVTETNNNNNNDSNDSGNDGEGEEGDADDVDDHPDIYNCALEEFAQNLITNNDKNVEVEEENNAKGVAPGIIVLIWYEKVSEWI